jgi:hypothetical protein
VVEPAGAAARQTAMTARLLLLLVAGCLFAAVACATPPGGPVSGGTASGGTVSGGTVSGGPTSGGPTSGEPVGGARQVFFDPQDLATPDIRTVLRTREDVAAYLRWLRTHPAPGLASPRLVATLAGQRLDGEVLVVFARTVGCDSVGRVELSRHGTDLRLDALDVQHHPECLRANHLVAVYALPSAAVPEGTTLDGAPAQPPHR